jgi:tetratricopeptide (TPR) repeat protein
MGEVYLAQDTELNRKVALKFLPPHLCADEDCRVRFKREAQAAAKLDHPNIVPVYEVGEFNSRPFFAMAHIEGSPLREVIRDGKLSVSDAIGFTMQICEGLNKAHESGVVHRDIKPGNIMIDTENRPRIVDFGLATVSGEAKLTKTGSTLGTVGYMSPEQIVGKQVDHRSDLFSVGVILYEMLTGRRPFEGSNDAAVARSITDTAPEPIARFKSGTTGELQQIVDKALAKDVSLRYQHADGMVADLKRLTLTSTPIKKSKLGLWAAVAVVVILAGYFAVDGFMHPDMETVEGWTNSVAVLVFRNLSGDPEQDFFCEGMTDEIIGRLGTIKGLKVTSMQSMLRFKGTDLDLKKIGKELGVENILEGRIQISGDDIRVRAQLIRVEDDAHIWTEKYDRELKSVFAIQDDISRAIAKVLEATLVDSEESFASRHGTDDIEAYNAYIRGRHFWRKRTEEGMKTAIEHFENAVALDSNYAAGWSGLSDGWSMLARYSYLDHLTGYSKADTFSLKALELNPNLAEAHTSRGWVLYLQSKYHEAEKHFLRAIELNPGYPWAHQWYSQVLEAMGKAGEANNHEQLAYQLDPLSPAILHKAALASRNAGNFEKAIDLCKTVLELEPLHSGAFNRLTQIYFDFGDTATALETAERMIQQLPDDPSSYSTKGWVFWQLGRLNEAQKAYEKAVEIAPNRWAAHLNLAWFLQQGRNNLPEALIHIERAVELDSLQARVRIFYGHVLRMLGRMDESLAQSKKVIELTPYDAEAYRAYGWAIGNGYGQYEEGIKYIKKGLELNPNHVVCLRSIALFYTMIWKTEEALDAINRSFDIDNSWAQAYQRKARIFARAGMFDSALVWYQKHHELRPYDNHTFGMLGVLNTFLQNYDKADSIHDEYLSQSSDPISRGWARSNQCDQLLYQGRFKEALVCYQEDIEVFNNV